MKLCFCGKFLKELTRKPAEVFVFVMFCFNRSLRDCIIRVKGFKGEKD